MSLVAFVADVHLGNPKRLGGPMVAGMNDRGRLVLESFRRACAHVAEIGCEAFVVLGDLFDTCDPSPAVIEGAQIALTGLRKGGINAYLLVGNHDLRSGTDHALAPLRDHAEYVAEVPMMVVLRDCALVLVPFFTRPDGATTIRELLARVESVPTAPRSMPRALGVHLGVIDQNTPHFLRSAEDAVRADELEALAADRGFDRVFCGNWHTARDYPRVHQCGALAPTGWDNPGLAGYGDVVVWDSALDTITRHNVGGPRFLSFRGLDEWDAYGGVARRHEHYVSLTVPPSDRERALRELENAHLNQAVGPYEVLIDGERAALALSRAGAASAVASVGGAEEAIVAFVAEMPLPEGVARERVLARALEYVK